MSSDYHRYCTSCHILTRTVPQEAGEYLCPLCDNRISPTPSFTFPTAQTPPQDISSHSDSDDNASTPNELDPYLRRRPRPTATPPPPPSSPSHQSPPPSPRVISSHTLSMSSTSSLRSDDMARRLDALPIKIPTFSGKDDEFIESLIDKLDSYATDHNEDNDFKLRRLPYLLKGRAHEVFVNLPESIKGDYERLISELRLNFGTPQLPSELAYKSLSSLKMDGGETVQIFYEKLLRNSKHLQIL